MDRVQRWVDPREQLLHPRSADLKAVRSALVC